MRLATLAAATLLSAASAAAQPAIPCEQGPFSFMLGDSGRVPTTIFPRAGQPCQVTIGTGGSGAQGTLLGLRVVERPRNGRAAISARNHYVYVPNPGFRGTDRFAVAVDGETLGRRGTTVLEVTVQMR